MPPADTLESSSDSVQDWIHQYDPALYKLEHRSDDDYKLNKVQFLSDAAKFTPPSTFKFPVTADRKYNTFWEKTRHWLRYSVKSDSASCAYCLCFGTVLNYPFVNQGFKNLKKAVGVMDGYLDRDANSVDHISLSERVFGFLHCIKIASTGIHVKIDKGVAEVQIRTKKRILSIIIRIILYSLKT